MADHLDQLHARYRIEEVHADEMVRPLQLRAQLLKRNARRIGGENRAGAHPGLYPRIDLALQIQDLRHRLDDEVGGARALAVEVGDESIERIANLGSLVPDLCEQVGRALDRAPERLDLHVRKRHRKPMPRAPRGYVAAHGAGADDVHALTGPRAVGQGFELLAQEEDPHQISRCFGGEEPRERSDLGLLHGARIAAVLLPEIDEGVRGGIMRNGRLLRGLRAHAPGGKPAGRRGIEDFDEHAAPTGLEPAANGSHGGGGDMALGHDRIHQTERSCPPGAHVAAGEHQGHGLDRIDQARQAHRASEPGMKTQHHLGKAEPRVIDRNAVVASERDLEATAEAIAVDDGNDRHGEPVEAIDERVSLAQATLGCVGLGHAAELTDVRAGNEAASSCRNAGPRPSAARARYA